METLLLPSNRGVAQPGSVLAWGASGRRFKSFRPDQAQKGLCQIQFFLKPQVDPNNDPKLFSYPLKRLHEFDMDILK